MSSTMTQERNRQSANYKMPEASINLPILWYQDGRDTTHPFAAFVTQIGGRTVDVVVYAPNGGKKIVTGARHISDPQATDTELNQSGAWDYADHIKRLRRMEFFVSDIIGKDISDEVIQAP